VTCSRQNLQSLEETATRSELVMKIGSIGAGNVGGALPKLRREAGHDVRAGGHDSVADVAAHGDIVLLAVPADAVDSALQAAGSLDGKVLIDATNNLAAEWAPPTLRS
jgi:predicted dinucleotide-binding enzyme